MNRCRRTAGGYTIIEVIIVLTVSSVLFATAVIGYTAQNRRTQFTESVNTFAQDLQDVLNDVESGFYPSTNEFSCTASTGGTPTIDPLNASEQGTNTGCIFMGRAIHFAPEDSSDSDSKSKIDIYTIVGRRLKGGPTTEPIANLTEARPKALSEVSNLIEHKSLVSGLEIMSVKQAGGGANKYSGLAVVSIGADSSGGISTGFNARSSLATIPGDIDRHTNFFLNRVSNMDSGNIDAAKNGIDICLREGGADKRFAIIELARDRSQIIVNTRIDTPPCT